VAQGVIRTGDCARPDDLSQVADAVFDATGSQLDLVNRLPRDRFKTARANRGHLVLIAFLLEDAVKTAITLNYDTAVISAVTELDAGDRIGIIEGPEDVGDQKAFNVFFLHRSAHRSGNEWIIRSVDLEESWKDGWESIVTAQIGASPCVLFAGLGTPVPVLIDTVKKIRDAYHGQRDRIYLAGPGQAQDSDFAAALNLVAENYIQEKWCALMDQLGRQLTSLMCDELSAAGKVIEKQRGYLAGAIDGTCDKLRRLDLVDLGRLRAAWLLSRESYKRDFPGERPLLADLLLGIALLEDVAGVAAGFDPTGIVRFTRHDGTANDQRGVLVFASGGGHLNWLTVEAELTSRLSQLIPGMPRPRRAIVAAVQGGRVPNPNPDDIAREIEDESIIFEPALELVDVEDLRRKPELVAQVVA